MCVLWQGDPCTPGQAKVCKLAQYALCTVDLVFEYVVDKDNHNPICNQVHLQVRVYYTRLVHRSFCDDSSIGSLRHSTCSDDNSVILTTSAVTLQASAMRLETSCMLGQDRLCLVEAEDVGTWWVMSCSRFKASICLTVFTTQIESQSECCSFGW